MAAIKIGVAAWHDIATYYPPGHRSSGDKLSFYSAEFPLVEVDTSYYAIPASHVPAAFTFDVKAFRLFTTHQTPPRFLPPDVRSLLPPELTSKRSLYYRDVPQWPEGRTLVDVRGRNRRTSRRGEARGGVVPITPLVHAQERQLPPLTTLEVLGLEVGDCMEAANLGLYVKVASMTRHRFTTESLEDAGVPAELIEKAILTSHSRSYLRIAPLKD